MGSSSQDDGVFEKLTKKRILFLSDEIDGEKALSLVATLLFLDLQNNRPITLCINSNGGTIENGLFTIYDTMQYIKSPIHTLCIGEASSSAAVLLSAGTPGKRGAYPSSKIMIHGVQVDGMSGSHKEISEEAERIRTLNNYLVKILSKHSKQPLKKVEKDCRKDTYFTPEEAVEYGLIDYVLQPRKK